MDRRTRHKGRFQPTALLAVLMMLVIVFVSTGAFLYLKYVAPPADSDPMATLGEQRARWAEEKPRGFRYVSQVECFCPPAVTRPYEVTERSGVVDVNPDSGAAPPEAMTVGEAFELAARAMREAHEVSVSYHPVYGFPATMNIDWIGDAVDDEMHVSISEFIVLDR